MNKKAQTDVVVRELVVGVGFLEGVWIATGLNPQNEMFKAFSSAFQSIDIPTRSLFLFKVIPIILLLGTIAVIFSLGGWLGALAVFLAFIGGITILKFPLFAVVSLIAGLFLGFIAFKK